MAFSHPALAGRVAVVTGGGGVLCGQFAHVLAAQGVKVAVLDVNENAAQAVVDSILAQGGDALPIVCDVLQKTSLQAAREAVLTRFGPADILVNGAGGNHASGTTSKETLEVADLEGIDPHIKTFFDLDSQGIEKVLHLNYLGALLPTQVFARDLAKKGRGSILMVSSMNAFRPLTKIPAYSAAKAAVSNLTQFMAVHFADVGIRVNALAPGFFSTQQNKSLLWNADGSATARTQKILAATPLHRFGTADELSGALLFLCDESYSAFVTGVILPVDGGFSAYAGV
jgi:NAD(P)-dependent dehydrogenase (short-subunit alcohol dehydrogenase family)